MALKSKNFHLDVAERKIMHESFGQASSNVSDALNTAVQMLEKARLEFSSYDAVALCQMIMDENYRLQMKHEELN